MSSTKTRILIIEDEPKVLESICESLRENGFEVYPASTGEAGLIALLEKKPDIMILDLNLPGRDGMEILQTVRQHNKAIHVLILSARDTIEDRVSGLNAGADDYLIKPFALSELIARLGALLRRESPAPVTVLQADDLKLDTIRRQAWRRDRKLNLTPREYELLELLLRNIDQPVARKTIARDVWKVERATSLDNVIDVHMMRLRKKVDLPEEPKLIHTVRGMGFMISCDPDKAFVL